MTTDTGTRILPGTVNRPFHNFDVLPAFRSGLVQFQHGSLNDRLEGEAPAFRILVHKTLREARACQKKNKKKISNRKRSHAGGRAGTLVFGGVGAYQKVVPAHVLPLVHRFLGGEHVRTVGELFEKRGLPAAHVALDEHRVRRPAVLVRDHGFRRGPELGPVVLGGYGVRSTAGTTFVRRKLNGQSRRRRWRWRRRRTKQRRRGATEQ